MTINEFEEKMTLTEKFGPKKKKKVEQTARTEESQEASLPKQP